MSNSSFVSSSRPAESRFHPLFTHWLPWLLWMGLIFLLSDQPKDESMRTSGWFAIIFEWIGMTRAELEAYHIITLIRKLAHFTIYLVLCWWTIRVELLLWEKGQWPWRALLWCFLFAISDEIHQTFVPGRGPQVLDIAIDTIGAAVGIWLWQVYQKKYISRSVNQQL